MLVMPSSQARADVQADASSRPACSAACGAQPARCSCACVPSTCLLHRAHAQSCPAAESIAPQAAAPQFMAQDNFDELLGNASYASNQSSQADLHHEEADLLSG